MTSERELLPSPLPVRRLQEFDDLAITLISGTRGLERTIDRPELNRPALELSGFFDKWQPERVQIFGSGELAYLEAHANDAVVQANLERIFSSHPPCLVITNDLPMLDEIRRLSEQYSVPVFTTKHHTTSFNKRLWEHLDYELSSYVVKRGVLMDVFNVGVLIAGESAIGKSECALELLSKGHTFVADDLILIKARQTTHLVGSGKSPVPHHMEIRGIGIIDVSRMYGPRSVRGFKQVDMVVRLENWDITTEYERLGIENPTTTILGIEIPEYTIPVRPGRNVASIMEVAVLDLKLKQSGVHMAREFDETLIRIMRKNEGR